jgi:hypothetical protein
LPDCGLRIANLAEAAIQPRSNRKRRAIGVLVCLFSLGLLVASLVAGIIRDQDKYSGIWWIVAASAVASLNFFLSYVRPLFYRWRSGSWTGYAHISGIPAVGTLFVLIGGIVGFGAWVSAVIGIAASLLDTGGLPWFLVSTWKDSALWDRGQADGTGVSDHQGGGQRSGMMEPAFPVLAVRPETSFWVSASWEDLSRCTLQAFENGCYCNLAIFDSTGMLRKVVEASLVRGPSFLDRLFPWRQIPVSIHLGGEKDAGVSEVATWLCAILASRDLLDEWDITDEEAKIYQRRIREARTPSELIAAAGMLD